MLSSKLISLDKTLLDLSHLMITQSLTPFLKKIEIHELDGLKKINFSKTSFVSFCEKTL